MTPARAAGYDELIAPPTMLQAWIMRGLRASLLTEEARAEGAEQGSGAQREDDGPRPMTRGSPRCRHQL